MERGHNARHMREWNRKQALRKRTMDDDRKFFGGMVVAIILINAAWIGFLIWAIWKIVTHVTS